MKKVSNNFYVSHQIQPSDIDNLHNEGFNIVICNRPDAEEPNQPSKADISLECQKHNIEFNDLEMKPGDINFATIEDTKKIIDSNQKVFAYCRTGTRSITLWALASCYTKDINEIMEEVSHAGFDLGHLKDIFTSFKANLS